MIDFSKPELIKKYGSWMRVQVAFYDFLFTKGTKLCPAHFNQAAKEAFENGFANGADVYENAVKMIEENLTTPQEAWNAFLEDSK